MATFNKKFVKRYMMLVVEHHRDECGEINCTTLAEDAAGHFGQDDEGGPLDDDTHWIWDLAVDVAKEVE